ncbi:MAG: hypothetical protein HC856_11045, partial [Pseudanabaena sp. RU_4_16]|nr:hypothetical protein [Pseudanabaena sp. RU_4_16]
MNEAFTYDNLNRLIQASGAVTKTYRYDAIGNITYKSDVGSYAYPASGANSIRPHAVTSVGGPINASYNYDANGNMIGGAGRTLTYTSFNKPASIGTGTASITYLYDANDNRIRQIADGKTTTYIGNLFEREVSNGVAHDKSYVYAGSTLVVIHT